MANVLIARVSYDVLIIRVLITRVDCIHISEIESHQKARRIKSVVK